MNLKRWMPPWAMINGIATSTILVVAMFLLANYALADDVFVTTFQGADYFYDNTTITSNQNMQSVWVSSTSQKFNIKHDTNYEYAEARYTLDCSGHSYAMTEAAVVSGGKVVRDVKLSEKDVHFGEVWEGTIQYPLFREICTLHPNI